MGQERRLGYLYRNYQGLAEGPRPLAQQQLDFAWRRKIQAQLLIMRRLALKIKPKQLVLSLVFLVMSSYAFPQTRQGINGHSINAAPGSTAPASGNGDPTTGPNAGGTSDASQQSIWKVAQQLGLTSDQRAQLDSSLKAQKDERAELDKAVRNARAALAHALANGQTFLDAEIESLASANAKVQESELKLWANLFAISTPDQQKQLLSMSTPLSPATAPHGIVQGQ